MKCSYNHMALVQLNQTKCQWPRSKAKNSKFNAKWITCVGCLGDGIAVADLHKIQIMNHFIRVAAFCDTSKNEIIANGYGNRHMDHMQMFQRNGWWQIKFRHKQTNHNRNAKVHARFDMSSSAKKKDWIYCCATPMKMKMKTKTVLQRDRSNLVEWAINKVIVTLTFTAKKDARCAPDIYSHESHTKAVVNVVLFLLMKLHSWELERWCKVFK